MRRDEEICGNCKYHRTDDTGEWICNNHDGEYFGLETDYEDTCPDYEER